MPGTCWLCLNSQHETAHWINHFILSRVATVSTDAMAEMVSEELQKLSDEGTSKREVMQHLQGGQKPALKAHEVAGIRLGVVPTHCEVMTLPAIGSRHVDADTCLKVFFGHGHPSVKSWTDQRIPR